jgi:rhamnogalacturonyl hydrolase YesR
MKPKLASCEICYSLVKTIVIETENKEKSLTICKRCLSSMLDNFKERKKYGKVEYIPF